MQSLFGDNNVWLGWGESNLVRVSPEECLARLARDRAEVAGERLVGADDADLGGSGRRSSGRRYSSIAVTRAFRSRVFRLAGVVLRRVLDARWRGNVAFGRFFSVTSAAQRRLVITTTLLTADVTARST